jgi:hypothetical protein
VNFDGDSMADCKRSRASVPRRRAFAPCHGRMKWNLDLGGTKNAEMLRCAPPAGVYPLPKGPNRGGLRPTEAKRIAVSRGYPFLRRPAGGKGRAAGRQGGSGGASRAQATRRRWLLAIVADRLSRQATACGGRAGDSRQAGRARQRQADRAGRPKAAGRAAARGREAGQSAGDRDRRQAGEAQELTHERLAQGGDARAAGHGLLRTWYEGLRSCLPNRVRSISETGMASNGKPGRFMAGRKGRKT